MSGSYVIIEIVYLKTIHGEKRHDYEKRAILLIVNV